MALAWLASSTDGGNTFPPAWRQGSFVSGGCDDSNMCLPEQSPRDAALAQLASLDPGLLDATELMGQIAGLAAFISQAQAHLARLAGTLDTTGGAAEGGYSSASAFLRTKCGLSPGHAAAVTSTARGLAARPATREAAEAGVISFDQAQIITRTTTWLEDPATAARIEQALLAHAPGLDTARFRRFAEEAAHSADPDAADEREQRRWERRHLSFGLTLDNTGMLSGSCGDAVSYEIVRTAAEAFGVPGGQADDRCAAQRRMDGLVAACKAALDSATAPGRHGMVPHLSILVCDQTLAQAAAAEAARAAGAAPGAPGAGGAPGGPAGQAAGTTPGLARRRGAWPGGERLPRPRGGRPYQPALSRRNRPDRRRSRPDGRRGDGPAGWCPARPDRARHHADRPPGPGLVLRRADHRDPLARRPAPRRRPHHAHRTPGPAPRPGGPRPGVPLARLRRPRHLGHRSPPHSLGPRRRHQPRWPRPVLPPAPPPLHPPPRLDHHRHPQRHAAPHLPRRVAHPRQPIAWQPASSPPDQHPPRPGGITCGRQYVRAV